MDAINRLQPETFHRVSRGFFKLFSESIKYIGCVFKGLKNDDFPVYDKICVSLGIIYKMAISVIQSVNILFQQITSRGCTTSFKYVRIFKFEKI